MAGGKPTAVTLELATESRSEDDCTGECDHRTDGVHHSRTGEVTEPHAVVRGLQEATRAPDPVADDRVDEPADADAVNEVADETRATDHRARRDGRAGVGERVLEQEEREERDSRVERTAEVVGGRCAVQEEERVADEAVPRPEHEREPERPEEDGAETGVDDALEQDVHHLAGAGKPGLEHHEPGLHEEHEEGRDERPCGVQTVDRVRDLGLHVICLRCERVHHCRHERVDGGAGADEAQHLSAQEGNEEPLPVPVRQSLSHCEGLH